MYRKYLIWNFTYLPTFCDSSQSLDTWDTRYDTVEKKEQFQNKLVKVLSLYFNFKLAQAHLGDLFDLIKISEHFQKKKNHITLAIYWNIIIRIEIFQIKQ